MARNAPKELAMSGHGEESTESTVAANNEEHVPAEEQLAADERPTPLWLSLVGLVVGLAAIFLLVANGSGDASDEAGSGAKEQAAAEQPAKAAERAAPPPRAPERTRKLNLRQLPGPGQLGQPGGPGAKPRPAPPPQPRPAPPPPRPAAQPRPAPPPRPAAPPPAQPRARPAAPPQPRPAPRQPKPGPANPY